MRTTLATLLVFVSVAHAAPVEYPANGHYYDFIVSPLWPLTGSFGVVPTWQEALAEAQTLSFMGMTGHLATITSAGENAFLFANFSGNSNAAFGWFAGTDQAVEGVWRWAAGPEAGTQFSQVGVPTGPDFYANWGGIEPNGIPGNHYTMMNLGNTFGGILGGEWADASNAASNNDPVVGYFVEYESGPLSVPEPLALLLLGVAALLLLVRMRIMRA